MSEEYRERIQKFHDKTQERLDKGDYTGNDYKFLQGEAHAYFTALMLFDNYHSIEHESQPSCASCGKTENLTPGIAGGNEISYCPMCKADEEMR